MLFWKIWNVIDFVINRGILFLFLKKNEVVFWKKKKIEIEFYKICILKKIIIE